MKPINLYHRAAIIFGLSKIIFFISYVAMILIGSPAWMPLFATSMIITFFIISIMNEQDTRKVSYLFKCNHTQLTNISEWSKIPSIGKFVEDCVSMNGYLDGFNYNLAKKQYYQLKKEA